MTIALFSTAVFGYSHTHSLLEKIFRLLHFHLSGRQFDFLHGVIRKAAHFTAYGILSGLLFRAFRGSWPGVRRWQFSWAALALGFCLLAASADELHQSVTAGRTGTWKDVVLDMVGACFVQALIVIGTAGNRNRRIDPPKASRSGGSTSSAKERLQPLRVPTN